MFGLGQKTGTQIISAGGRKIIRVSARPAIDHEDHSMEGATNINPIKAEPALIGMTLKVFGLGQ